MVFPKILRDVYAYFHISTQSLLRRVFKTLLFSVTSPGTARHIGFASRRDAKGKCVAKDLCKRSIEFFQEMFQDWFVDPFCSGAFFKIFVANECGKRGLKIHIFF